MVPKPGQQRHGSPKTQLGYCRGQGQIGGRMSSPKRRIETDVSSYTLDVLMHGERIAVP